MKKLIFMLTFIGSFGFFVNPSSAQQPIDDGNGKVCCLLLDHSCTHPTGEVYADSILKTGSTCP